MKANISIYEAILRLFIGIVWAGVFGGWLGSYIGVLALYPIVTSMSGWCLFYAMKHKFTNEENPYTEHERASSAVPAGQTQEEPKYRMTA